MSRWAARMRAAAAQRDRTWGEPRSGNGASSFHLIWDLPQVPLREVAATVPLERLLVETDAPYLAPVPRRGKRNEPAYVAHTAARIAEIRGMEEGAFAAATTDNFFRLFAKAQSFRCA